MISHLCNKSDATKKCSDGLQTIVPATQTIVLNTKSTIESFKNNNNVLLFFTLSYKVMDL